MISLHRSLSQKHPLEQVEDMEKTPRDSSQLVGSLDELLLSSPPPQYATTSSLLFLILDLRIHSQTPAVLLLDPPNLTSPSTAPFVSKVSPPAHYMHCANALPLRV